MIKKILSAALAAAVTLSCFSAVAAPSAAQNKNGVWAEYYTGKFAKYSSARKEQTINNKWSASALPPGMKSRENFSVKYFAKILSGKAGTYKFYSEADDGVQISLDGKKIISDNGPHLPNELSGSISLAANTYYDLTIDYYNGNLDGVCRVYWEAPGGKKEIIPAASLFIPRPVRTEVKTSGSKVYARAYAMTDENFSYSLVLEKLSQNGEVTENLKANRASNASVWETDKMTYDKNCDYAAYAVDKNFAVVSDTDELLSGADAAVTIDKNDESPNNISPLMYGACLEDVNHELYGGIWSQLIFGESFAEPAASYMESFTPAGGAWGSSSDSGTNQIDVANQSNGPKLIINDSEMSEGEISADVRMNSEGPAGFIIKTTDAKEGADNFNGYEVGISNNKLRIGKHEYNYNNIGDYDCSAPENTWVNLKIVMTEASMQVYIDQKLITTYTDPNPLKTGAVGLRAWNCSASFKNIVIKRSGEAAKNIKIEYPLSKSVSSMWSPVERENAVGRFGVTNSQPYKGSQSQSVAFESGSGAIGISNSSLNRKGMNFEKSKEYEGYFYARSENPVTAFAVIESADGSKKYAEAKISVSGNDWKKYSFTLTPNEKDSAGRITIELRSVGAIDLGYVFFQPGEWGRFEGLPVRKDIAELLKEQGVTVLRFGGCMAQNSEYKWKNMLSSAEQRPSYKGWWYDYSSYGFGIVEFMDLCEKLGVVGIPDFSASETAEDMEDFIDFATGTDEQNEWVKKRIALGHKNPYSLPYLQYGNEEKVNAAFAEKFNAVANKIWAKNDDVIMVAGDFAYQQVITDPNNFAGADSGITNLEGHKMILDNAVEHSRPVWFDIHIWTERTSDPNRYFDAAKSLYSQLKKLSPNAEFKLPVFEFNANTHDMERALTNAYATIKAEQLSDIFPIVVSANCLQVDGHNDNGWDQGLIFMNNDSSWLQPPAYVTQMFKNVYQSTKLDCSSANLSSQVEFTAVKSDDGKKIAFKAANLLSKSYTVRIKTPGFSGNTNTVIKTVLKASSAGAVNTADKPENVTPEVTTAKNALKNNTLLVTLEPRSFTTVEIAAESENIAPSSISITPQAKTINVSDKFTAKYDVSENTACNSEVLWSSSDPLTASVFKGTITGLRSGSAVITAALKNYPNISASLTVTVKTPPAPKPVLPSGLKLSASKLTMSVKTSKKLSAKVSPPNASNKTVSWKSSNKSVVSVSGGKITARAPGKAVITAVCSKVSSSCTVTVNPAKPSKVKLTNKKGRLTVKYKKGAGGKYSKIVVLRNGKKFKTKITTKSSYNFKASKKGVYKVKIYSCKKIGKKVYSSGYRISNLVKIKKSK